MSSVAFFAERLVDRDGQVIQHQLDAGGTGQLLLAAVATDNQGATTTRR